MARARQYVLGYSDERNESGDPFRSVRIDNAGNVLTPEGIEVSPTTHSVGSLEVASNGQICKGFPGLTQFPA